MDYAHRLFTKEEDGFQGFSIGLLPNADGQWQKRQQMKYEIGWCGQNASLAVSLLHDFQTTGNDLSLTRGFAVLDSWASMSRGPTGLFLPHYDPDTETVMDACNLGTAAVQYFAAYDIAQELGYDKPAYLDVAYGICDFATQKQHKNGCIGENWHKDGTPRVLQGSTGAFLIPALLLAGNRKPNTDYVRAAESAFKYYFDAFKANTFTTAGALDTCCIDKESCMPLLRSALLLYQHTGDSGYIRKAIDAAWYLSTWQWHHHVQYEKDTVLHQLGYDTFGGTAVSTAHHHLDAYALYYMTDLIELARISGDETWKQRAIAIWHNATQCISDGTMRVMGTDPCPPGSSYEAYLQTRWGIEGIPEPFFSVSLWLVAWPVAFRLEYLRGLESSFDITTLGIL